MKIGIISSYAFIKNNNNYGALLQYFALQTYFQKMGHEAYWIRTIVSRNTPLNLLKKLYHFKSLRLFINWICVHRGFMKFVRKFLSVTDSEYSSFNEIQQNPPFADVYVTGSDQVWGSEKLKENYLLFAPKGRKKIAYAASFGRDSISDDMAQTIKPWIDDFYAISVRESSGVEICKKMGVAAEHLIDPTFLIGSLDYPSSPKRRFSKPYIYCYFLNAGSRDAVRYEELKAFAQRMNLDLRICAVQGTEKLFEKKYLVFPTPEEWLTDYRHAEYIVTNTFHGTVFALINHKSFASILQKGATSKQNSRLASLLETFAMQKHLCLDSDNLDEVLFRPFDWPMFENVKKGIVSKTDAFFERNLR